MSNPLQELYQEVIVDHSRRPRNFRAIDDATSKAEGHNPLCGDQLTLYLKMSDGVIADIAFQGDGCAISKASASLMTAAVKGKNKKETLALFARVHALLIDGPRDEAQAEELGKLAVLSGVWEFPMRVKCASLAWHTLRSAIDAKGDAVSTQAEEPKR